MTHAERKLALGIPPTAIDLGFQPDFGSGKYESEFLPGKAHDRRKLRAPAGEDLSHLNSRNIQHFQRIGRAGGRAKK